MDIKRNAVTTTLLIGILLFIAQPATAAKASSQPADPALQAWLGAAPGLEEEAPASEWGPLLHPVARFYQREGFQPAWTSPVGLLPQGEILLQAMARAAEAGLLADDYRLPYIENIGSHGLYASTARPLLRLAPHVQFDVMLTARMLRFAQHLSQGRVTPEALPQKWFARRRPSTRDIPTELARALDENRLAAYIESLHPKGQAYGDLRKTLGRYEAIKRSGGWPTILPGPALRIGDNGPRVDALKRRLSMTADLPADTPTAHDGIDAIVEAAVKRYQRRNGLTPDGVVGQHTRAELNISVERRITQMQLNMERWRWLPDSLGDRYILVNIPAFELCVVEANTRIDSMRVVVGKKRRQTPVMSGRMTYLEINPYWNIPQKIARKDILPKIINDPAYLTRQGIRVFDSWDRQARELDPAGIAWETISKRYFPFRLRQDPSIYNALGRVKFMFPNPHSIYIHDTPGKTLFDHRERTFSSGCVRVEAPEALAQYLLSERGWDRARLESAIDRGQRRTMLLTRPIPVHLVYFTAWVDDHGRVNFRKDIYERDRRLLLALKKDTSDLIFCGNEAEKHRLPATYAATTISPNASAIEATDHPMTGI